MPQWLEIILRTLCAVIVLFLLTKALGKRQVTQLSFFEYLTGITIGSLAAYISLDLEANWYLGLIALGVWVLCSLLIEYSQMKSKKVRDFIDFKATVLIKDGKVLEDNMKKERLTSDDLMQQLRKKDIFQIADVEFAIMESSGDITVLQKRDTLPVTPKDLGVKIAPEKMPQAVIMDGKILDEPLRVMGFSQSWLKDELDKQGVKLKDVYFAQVDTFGGLTIDLYDDQMQQPQNQERALLFANLKKCQADLELFSLSTKDKAAKKMYEESAKEMARILQEVKPILNT
ncbi:DUF421 domain-containing protein [Paenibacillus lactis]|jgi:uncharacterized membrane protein YcaP (DUF421 family)|uniref:DUF421 domain-containing protein n=1 Tax=Paenibacillus lactis TaxID=228574 RepID=UPI00048D2B84|nr:DUF421 domain-containing protein [Paenibacillus lactis]MCM3492969.1 DUF421 domain-containing protein [Paenibacillus lactis]